MQPGWPARQALGKEFQADQQRLQRIVRKFAGAAEHLVELAVMVVDVAAQHRMGEFALVAEMVEEAALGQPGLGDDLLDRGRGKALGEHRGFGDLPECVRGCRRPCPSRNLAFTVPAVRFSGAAQYHTFGQKTK